MRPKTQKECKWRLDLILFSVWWIQQGPGPGTYTELSTRPDGIYPMSTFMRTKSPKFKLRINPNPTSSNYDRVPNLGKQAPGPGHYNVSSVLIT